MKPTTCRVWRRRLAAWSVWGVAATVLCGCGNQQQDADQQMRKSFQSKGVSINDVPAEQRERVKAYMQQYAKPAPPAR